MAWCRSVVGAIALLVPLLQPTAAAGQRQDAWERTWEARKELYHQYLEAPSLIEGGSIQAVWLPGGDAFWYAEGAPANTVIRRVDAAANRVEALFDVARVRTAVAEALGHALPYAGLPFSTFAWERPGEAVRFEVEGRTFVLELADYAVRAVPASSPREVARRTPRVVRDSWPVAAGPLREVPSPDGRWYLLDRDGELWLRASVDGRERRLTDGAAEWYGWSASGARWSPDGLRVAALKSDAREVHRIPVVHWLKPVEEVSWLAYPHAGGAVAQPELHVVDATSGRTVEVDTGEERDRQLTALGWSADGGSVYFLRTDRRMRRVELMAGDAVTGASRVLVRDSSETFIEGLRMYAVASALFTPVGDAGGRFLWLSERDGWTHLYLYEADGTPIRRLTSGSFPVLKVEAVDAEGGWVYYSAHGDVDRPYDTHLYRVPLEGGRAERLTEAPGVHQATFSPSRRFFLDTHSSVDRPPVVELRRADGGLVRVLSQADVSRLTALGWTAPEAFTVLAADDSTVLHGILFKPPAFDPSQKYPVLDLIYAGSQTPVVPWAFGAGGFWGGTAQALAQLGFVTFIVDARGTPERGKAFQDVVYGAIGRHEIPDHVAALRQLAAERPYMDLGRVGIHGYSWGGYFTLRAVLTEPDVYHAAVSGSPVVGLDAVAPAPIEPYMGLPQDDPEGYRYASNLPLADRLKAKLLITIGTADVNTPFAQTMQMAEALIRADRPFDLLILPDQNHGLDGRSQRYFQDAMARYFVEHLRP